MLINGVSTIWSLFFATSCIANITSPYALTWSSSNNILCSTNGRCGPSGPDGPWHAPVVDFRFLPNSVPLYPSLSDEVEVFYPSYVPSGTNDDGHLYQFGDLLINQSVSAFAINASLSLIPAYPQSTLILDKTFTFLVQQWKIGLLNGSQYSPQVGYLAVGKRFMNAAAFDPTNGFTSRSWSMHYGSASLSLLGSFVFGGYEQNRALGPVASFDIVKSTDLRTFLVDVTLGVDNGASPFNPDLGITKDISKSMWRSLGSVNSNIGAPFGAAAVYMAPEYPGIYLPQEVCAAIATMLPVIWQPNIGYYTWNTSHPSYQRITTSPGYLGFVFADRFAKNITIKVPFPLLNLTLEPPIVATPTPYFPCHSYNGSTAFLGRAFFQSAFLAANWDSNLFYLAQGPGPNLDQSIMQVFPTNGAAFPTNSLDSFSKTWSTFWTPILAQPDAEPHHETGTGLSPGAIAGVVIGALAGAALIGAGLWLLFKKKQRTNSQSEESHKIPGYTHEAEARTAQMCELATPDQHLGLAAPSTSHISELPAS
ncbi:hypothetical protein VHEMI01313 [[Torrubiella] hemipterigena]|uniref:Peptidase A1 domain-containing protein n=1 Tax=[Torrubiella] hemipterigena TaxID=1531966 RepID=A0A0A1T777_9HYPO|nr:hypothetical protein VHEMI01313 [[Torrubiella] hemipterigena]